MGKEIARLAITATGLDLLRMIAVEGHLFVTKAEGLQVCTDGDAVLSPEPAPPEGLNTIVLTDAGKAKLAALPEAAAAVVAKALFDLDDDVPMPSGGRSRSRDSKYPIKTMNVGQSFHIPATADMKDPVAAIASTLTSARAEYAIPEVGADGNPTGATETVKVNVYQRDEAGKIVKGEDGKRIVLSVEEVTRPKMTVVRDWSVKAVNANDPKGVGARVWRTK